MIEALIPDISICTQWVLAIPLGATIGCDIGFF